MTMVATGSLFQRFLQWLWWGFEKERMKGKDDGEVLGPKHKERKGRYFSGGITSQQSGCSCPWGRLTTWPYPGL